MIVTCATLLRPNRTPAVIDEEGNCNFNVKVSFSSAMLSLRTFNWVVTSLRPLGVKVNCPMALRL